MKIGRVFEKNVWSKLGKVINWEMSFGSKPCVYFTFIHMLLSSTSATLRRGVGKLSRCDILPMLGSRIAVTIIGNMSINQSISRIAAISIGNLHGSPIFPARYHEFAVINDWGI